ncbi:hypothetical protein QBC47DRAFT_169705 [Echria macrotheca]|uniref:Malate dehydrogenase n=1 Tax=Echria macrotheca TaxID=438768 RepID=A0AAJ0FAY7_9PEZI|nr:hypothetical protein QBC47DRAFT_169705 [Echria macrotheca]
MVSTKTLVLAALAAVAYAAPPAPPPKASPPPPPPPPKGCQPTPTLPLTGGASELPAPPANVTLKKIAVGHGIQNYTCGSDITAAANSSGALAVLYDVTPLYPGTPRTGLAQAAFDTLTTTTLWTQAIPLNLIDPAAAAPGVVLSSKSYGATASPFPPKADLKLGNMPPIKFLGHHYFDASNTPTFDLSAAGLLANVVKAHDDAPPANADKGPLGTGAVKWLQLVDSNKGISKGATMVYRVITAGGVAESCATTGAGATTSVPYTAFYWFYG